MSDITPIELPTWLTGQQATSLAKAAEQYWQEVEQYFLFWLEQLSDTTDQLAILDLLAWERGINRLDGEDIELYKLRIKHAVANSEDAGSIVGMERIFIRLGFGFAELEERLPGLDWDIVEISLLEDEFNGRQALVESLIRQYGRTCRRYVLKVLSAIDGYYGISFLEFDREVAQ